MRNAEGEIWQTRPMVNVQYVSRMSHRQLLPAFFLCCSLAGDARHIERPIAFTSKFLAVNSRMKRGVFRADSHDALVPQLVFVMHTYSAV